MAVTQTYTPEKILRKTLAAMKKSVPELDMVALDQRPEGSHHNQKVTAHIRALPVVGDYGASGYFSNTNDAQGLLTDVPVTLDQHKHVTLELTHAQAISQEKIDLSLEDAGYVLGKSIIDNALAKVVAANFSLSEVFTVANSDLDMLEKVRETMNLNGADTRTRFALVNSLVATTLGSDPRIASRDFLGQAEASTGGNPIREWRGVGGFRRVLEYPDFPANAENQTSFGFDGRAIAVSTALPAHTQGLAQTMGIPSLATYRALRDPATGITLLFIGHSQPGTLNLYFTLAIIYGTAAGKQGEAAGSLTDYAGVRVTTV